jgi:hypothetical protein
MPDIELDFYSEHGSSPFKPPIKGCLYQEIDHLVALLTESLDS